MTHHPRRASIAIAAAAFAAASLGAASHAAPLDLCAQGPTQPARLKAAYRQRQDALLAIPKVQKAARRRALDEVVAVAVAMWDRGGGEVVRHELLPAALVHCYDKGACGTPRDAALAAQLRAWTSKAVLVHREMKPKPPLPAGLPAKPPAALRRWARGVLGCGGAASPTRVTASRVTASASAYSGTASAYSGTASAYSGTASPPLHTSTSSSPCGPWTFGNHAVESALKKRLRSPGPAPAAAARTDSRRAIEVGLWATGGRKRVQDDLLTAGLAGCFRDGRCGVPADPKVAAALARFEKEFAGTDRVRSGRSFGLGTVVPPAPPQPMVAWARRVLGCPTDPGGVSHAGGPPDPRSRTALARRLTPAPAPGAPLPSKFFSVTPDQLAPPPAPVAGTPACGAWRPGNGAVDRALAATTEEALRRRRATGPADAPDLRPYAVAAWAVAGSQALVWNRPLEDAAVSCLREGGCGAPARAGAKLAEHPTAPMRRWARQKLGCGFLPTRAAAAPADARAFYRLAEKAEAAVDDRRAELKRRHEAQLPRVEAAAETYMQGVRDQAVRGWPEDCWLDALDAVLGQMRVNPAQRTKYAAYLADYRGYQTRSGRWIGLTPRALTAYESLHAQAKKNGPLSRKIQADGPLDAAVVRCWVEAGLGHLPSARLRAAAAFLPERDELLAFADRRAGIEAHNEKVRAQNREYEARKRREAQQARMAARQAQLDAEAAARAAAYRKAQADAQASMQRWRDRQIPSRGMTPGVKKMHEAWDRSRWDKLRREGIVK